MTEFLADGPEWHLWSCTGVWYSFFSAVDEWIGSNIVNTIPPIQQNPMQNGYDQNKGYDESFENKCVTNYSIITNNSNDTHNKQLTMHNKYTNDDVDFHDGVVHIMRWVCT